MMRIELSEEKGRSFTTDELKDYIQKSGRDYIIQGQEACRRSEHSSPHSLDCWLRDNFANYRDRKQATNALIKDLVETGEFIEGKFQCPDRKKKTKRKGVRIVK
ncbi:hypothetical protein AZH53_03090 [Methanomicrobiaceae archaeon CYW5]|uniref:hypothetical protein n=1 Tax=Methanovulcanius yangii TaxID=1789227 RepID=UPI0029CA4E82|nr:hypothetical protein [Methanovulcanius yangii]MBT8507414.1 hypothetical protein [Methanovulcanius yangii]